MDYTFLYKLSYYDEITHSEQEECGILYAETFVQAATRLEDYYGEDLTSILLLEPYDTSMFTFPVDKLETVKELLTC